MINTNFFGGWCCGCGWGATCSAMRDEGGKVYIFRGRK